MQKSIIFSLIFFVFYQPVLSQNFTKLPLLKEDEQKGVIMKFSAPNPAYSEIILLFKDSSFSYQFESSTYNGYSKGTWKRTRDKLILNSYFKANNLPVKLEYGFDTSSVNRRIEIVKNLNNENLHDALVYVNSDSIYCFPDALLNKDSLNFLPNSGCRKILNNEIKIDSIRISINKVS